MDNRIAQMNLKRPRGMVGSPYQVVCPSFHPPIINPPPRPLPNINITVNNNDDDNDDKHQFIIDENQNLSIYNLSGKVREIENTVNDIVKHGDSSGSLQLGEDPGTAYPGDKGKFNANSIVVINSRIDDLLKDSVKRSDLLAYATNENLSDSVTAMNNSISEVEKKIPTSLSSFSDYNTIPSNSEIEEYKSKVGTLENSVNVLSKNAVTQGNVQEMVDKTVKESPVINTTMQEVLNKHSQEEDDSLSGLIGEIDNFNNSI